MFRARTNSIKSVQGFTLLELLIVVSILSSIAYIAIDSVADSENLNRWQRTQNRLDNLRYAMIGDSTRRLNGGSELSGFVVDMGRLPECLNELITRSGCESSIENLAEFTLHDNQMAGGWRGPYLTATHRLGDYDAYRDGWGNSSESDDADNFSWLYGFDETELTLSVQSIGADRMSDAQATDNGIDIDTLSDYELDYPDNDSQALIGKFDYQIELTQYTDPDYLGGIDLDLSVSVDCEDITCDPADPSDPAKGIVYVCLVISSIIDGELSTDDPDDSTDTDENIYSRNSIKLTIDGLANGTEQNLRTFTFAEDNENGYLAIGRHYATLLKSDSGNTTCSGNVGTDELTFPFNVLSSTSGLTLQGDLQ